MAAPDKDTSALFLSGSVVLIAALGGYLWYQAPLKSARPANPGLERHEAALAKRAEARLWQDPLAAVDAHLKTSGEKATQTDRRGWLTLANEIAARLDTDATPITTNILMVMMDGSPYVEGTEQRIRDRYAVGSALSAACYVPEDGTHVGYALSDSDPPIPLPFEWYKPRALRDCAPSAATPTVHGQVLVLWLSDELFGNGHPLRTLSTLTTSLSQLVSERYRARAPTAGIPPLTFEMIGPSGSDLLREMAQEAKEAGDSGQRLSWPPTRDGGAKAALPMYSPAATVSAEVIAHSLLGPRRGAAVDADQWLVDTLERAGVRLVYRIPSDYELTRTLLHELSVRGVRGNAHIAILAEWDSYYGRTLSSEFVAAACMEVAEFEAASGTSGASERTTACGGHGAALEAVANPSAQQRLVPHLRQYTYLRGLDGELPGGESGGAKTPKAASLLNRGADRSLDALERPEGESQLDYVRRLADRLEADSENRDFRAIGILGSDVYDKLLILQALRKRFPHALFFTTDLDARLIHPSQYDWTHNVIIASHFGLQVHPALQQAIPPFRSSYQAATFVAVLRAIGHLQTTTPTGGFTTPSEATVTLGPRTAPLVYEVGRTGADLLPGSAPPATGQTDRPQTGGVTTAAAVAQDLDAINHPVSSVGEAAALHDRQVRFLLLAVAVLCAIYLAIPVIRSIPEDMLSADMGQFIIHTAVAMAVALGLATAAAQWLGTRPDAEPFFWAEGISIWPSEVLRVTVAVLAIGFLRLAQTHLTGNAERLTNSYALDEAVPPTAPPMEWTRWRHWTNFLSPTTWSIDFSRNAVSPSALWQEHMAYERTAWRRIVPQTLLMGVLGIILLNAFGRPHPPVRGTLALVVHTVSWVLSSLLTGLLIFYVVDAIRVCTGFIHQFALEPTRWAPRVLQALSERRNLPPDIVSEWMDIRFIAERTKAVGSLIHYPILALFLMVFARHRIFDDWSYPPGMLLIYGICAAYILISAVLLSMAAEKARRSATGRLRGYLYELRGQAHVAGQTERSNQQLAQVELMLQDIHGIQEGAFAHWTQHPVFQAVLVPSGGFSVLALMDYFLTQ